MNNEEKIISMLEKQQNMLEKQQKTLDMLVMAQQTTNERLDSLEKTQSKMERNIAGVNRSVIGMDERLEKAESSIFSITNSINKYDRKYANLYTITMSIDVNVANIEGRADKIESKLDKIDERLGEIEDIAEDLQEHPEISRAGMNKLLDWAERVEKSTLTTITIPPLTVVE